MTHAKSHVMWEIMGMSKQRSHSNNRNFPAYRREKYVSKAKMESLLWYSFTLVCYPSAVFLQTSSFRILLCLVIFHCCVIKIMKSCLSNSYKRFPIQMEFLTTCVYFCFARFRHIPKYARIIAKIFIKISKRKNKIEAQILKIKT